MRKAGRSLLLTAAVALSACALARVTPDRARTRETVVDGEKFELSFEPIDRDTADQIVRALQVAVPRISKWGRFTAPIRLTVEPSHEALERAVHRLNYPWLRAWSRYDTVDLQSPRTWSALGATPSQVEELLTHELTHCLMYQRAGNAATWMLKGFPLWFREGMASVTSRQGYRRPTDEDLWRWMQEHPGVDPVRDADALYQSESAIVYGAAHRAFEFLVGRYGDGAVRRLLDEMHAGADFDEAFVRAVGLSPDAFTREFVNYVRWEGWRGDAGKRAGPLVSP